MTVRLPLARPSLARKHAPSQRMLCVRATAEPLDMDPLEKCGPSCLALDLLMDSSGAATMSSGSLQRLSCVFRCKRGSA